MIQSGYDVSSIRSVMSICGALFRRKKLDEACFGESSLARILNTFDLTALGVGSTLGVGIYVLAGDVSKTVAGPAVVVSFFLAAITSAFAGLCYAEFGARVPKAGSAYIYSYYTVGELVAFVIGWGLILEYVIGVASVARGISTYIDTLLSNKIRDVFLSFAPMESPFMSQYVDFFAFLLCIALACALAFGVRESTMINNFLTFCNMSVVSFIIISGLFKIDFHNWQLDKNELPGPQAGEGGFAPFGLIGIIRGAAICFYGFIGFDIIATTGEEVKNPQRAIPMSIMISLLITFLAYFGVSSVLTLMWPYYLQDPDAPLPFVYSQIGWEAAKWLVSIGALFGLFSSLFGAMFPLPRIIYAMASDGLLFRVLGHVNSRTKTPIFGTAVAGLATATMAALFNLQQLISLVALGTLLAYTIVAISVIILRYSPDFDGEYKEIGESTSLVSECSFSARVFFWNYFSFGADAPTNLTKWIVIFNVILFSVASTIVSLLLMHSRDICGETQTGIMVFVCILGVIMLITFLSMCSQPKARKCLPFQMPLVPLLPCLSIFLNIYLMVVLDGSTWIKLAIWMSAGIIPYICWYYWKYRHGELGENSRYNINRVNHIKLNELVSKLHRDRINIIDGYVNKAFVSNEEPSTTTANTSAGDVELTTLPKTIKPSIIYDEIYVYDEFQKTEHCVEINNNVYKSEEPEPEEWRSVAEVHAVVEKSPDTLSENINLEEEAVEMCTEQSAPEKGSEQDVNSDNTEPKIIEDGIFDNGNPTEKIFGPEITIRPRVTHHPRVKINLDNKLNRVVIESEKPEEETEPKKPFRRGNDLLSGEMREKLSKILQEQASFIQSGMEKPFVEEEKNSNETDQRSASHIDVKILTKAEIMNKLQHLLKNGPPKKPSFRRPPVIASVGEDGPSKT